MSKKPANPAANPAQDNPFHYPTIEALLESEKFDRINQSFGNAYQTLDGIHQDRAAGLKKQKDSRKAMRTLELTTDLIKELLKLKYQLQLQQKAK